MANSEKTEIIKKIQHMIRISDGDARNFYDVIDLGKIRADEYCPTSEECDSILVQNLPKYLPFMLWIDETGYETPENAKNRQYLRQMIYSRMIVL